MRMLDYVKFETIGLLMRSYHVAGSTSLNDSRYGKSWLCTYSNQDGRATIAIIPHECYPLRPFKSSALISRPYTSLHCSRSDTSVSVYHSMQSVKTLDWGVPEQI